MAGFCAGGSPSFVFDVPNGWSVDFRDARELEGGTLSLNDCATVGAGLVN